MKRFKITFVRSALQTCTLEISGKDKHTASEVAFLELPAVEQFVDQPELASYEIEKITEIKEAKCRAKKSM